MGICYSLWIMGDMADMLLESCFDDFMGWADEFGYPVRERKELRCSHCNKNKLAWRQVKKKWVLFERDGNVHSCHGYEPPLEILKELAKQTLEEARKDALWRLQEKAKKRGGVKRMINIFSDQGLLDLYMCFVRDSQIDPEEVGMKFPFQYKNELNLLREEILRRMEKK